MRREIGGIKPQPSAALSHSHSAKNADHETHTRYEPDAPEGADEPLPRDPQNQQAEQGEDPLAIPVPDWPDSAAPETDVAGTGRRGDAHDAQHENPDVDEPVD